MPEVNLPILKPRLRKVSPFIFNIAIGFNIVDLCLGIGLFNTTGIKFPIVTPTFSFQFWGIVFISLGITGIVSLAINRWKLIRRVLTVGLFLKALWAYALIFDIQGISSLSPISLWVFVVYIQLLVVIHFPE